MTIQVVVDTNVISGDKDLLELKRYQNTTILTATQFITLLDAPPEAP